MKKINHYFKPSLLLPLLFACVVLVGCEEDKSEYKLNTKQAALKTKESITLNITPSIEGLSFESYNPLIADCDNGVVSANLVGETQIHISSENNFNAICKVQVLPRLTLYQEPLLLFGRTPNDIKSRETRRFHSESTQTTNGNQMKSLFFVGENDYVNQVTYVFIDSELVYSYMLLPEEEAENITAHMEERFLYVGADDDKIVYIHPTPPFADKPNQFILISYSAFIDKDENDNPLKVYIAVDYELAELSGASNSPVSIKNAVKAYIKSQPKHRFAKSVR